MIDKAKMQPFQLRVLEEKEELDKKRMALARFLQSKEFALLGDGQHGILYRQYRVMGEYSLVLEERIYNFKEVKE